jgi:hypothetical protein
MTNELERLRDMIGGIYALIEPDEPGEACVGAARSVAGEAHYLAKILCDRQEADTLELGGAK